MLASSGTTPLPVKRVSASESEMHLDCWFGAFFCAEPAAIPSAGTCFGGKYQFFTTAIG